MYVLTKVGLLLIRETGQILVLSKDLLRKKIGVERVRLSSDFGLKADFIEGCKLQYTESD